MFNASVSTPNPTPNPTPHPTPNPTPPALGDPCTDPAACIVTLNGIMENPIHPVTQPTEDTLPGLTSSEKVITLRNHAFVETLLDGWSLSILRDNAQTVDIPLSGQRIPASG